MCAGCPGGRAVSRVTAYINLNGMKHDVLTSLQRRVGERAKIATFGDQWVLRTRIGVQLVLVDVEALAHALLDRGLLGPGSAGAGAVVHPPADHDAVRTGAERFVGLLLADAAAARNPMANPLC